MVLINFFVCNLWIFFVIYSVIIGIISIISKIIWNEVFLKKVVVFFLFLNVFVDWRKKYVIIIVGIIVKLLKKVLIFENFFFIYVLSMILKNIFIIILSVVIKIDILIVYFVFLIIKCKRLYFFWFVLSKNCNEGENGGICGFLFVLYCNVICLICLLFYNVFLMFKRINRRRNLMFI